MTFDEFVDQSVCYGTNMWCGIDFEPVEEFLITRNKQIFAQKRKLYSKRRNETPSKLIRQMPIADAHSSMTQLLTNSVKHSTKTSSRPKPNNQFIKKFLSLVVS